MNTFRDQSQNLKNLTLVLGGTGENRQQNFKKIDSERCACPYRFPLGFTILRLEQQNKLGNLPARRGSGLHKLLRRILPCPVRLTPSAVLLTVPDIMVSNAWCCYPGVAKQEAQACEKIVQASGLDWTIIRASWFNQNFSEGAFVDMVLSGKMTLPTGEIS